MTCGQFSLSLRISDNCLLQLIYMQLPQSTNPALGWAKWATYWPPDNHSGNPARGWAKWATHLPADNYSGNSAGSLNGVFIWPQGNVIANGYPFFIFCLTFYFNFPTCLTYRTNKLGETRRSTFNLWKLVQFLKSIEKVTSKVNWKFSKLIYIQYVWINIYKYPQQMNVLAVFVGLMYPLTYFPCHQDCHPWVCKWRSLHGRLCLARRPARSFLANIGIIPRDLRRHWSK